MPSGASPRRVPPAWRADDMRSRLVPRYHPARRADDTAASRSREGPRSVWPVGLDPCNETQYHHAMTAAPILRTLDEAGHRLTEPRRAVAELVDRRVGHFTAADLVSDARDRKAGIGRATVFRALELFQELGVIERIDLPSGVHAYVVCEPDHHHHVICSNCGRSADIDDRGLKGVTKKIAKRTGYRIDQHRIELFGLCPTCQAAAGR